MFADYYFLSLINILYERDPLQHYPNFKWILGLVRIRRIVGVMKIEAYIHSTIGAFVVVFRAEEVRDKLLLMRLRTQFPYQFISKTTKNVPAV